MTTPTFAQLLAAFRAKEGWSQNHLAHETGYDHSYIGRLEAGKRSVSAGAVRVLAYTLDLDRYDTARLYRAAGYWPPSVVGAALVALDDLRAVVGDRLDIDALCRDWSAYEQVEDRALVAANGEERGQ